MSSQHVHLTENPQPEPPPVQFILARNIREEKPVPDNGTTMPLELHVRSTIGFPIDQFFVRLADARNGNSRWAKLYDYLLSRPRPRIHPNMESKLATRYRECVMYREREKLGAFQRLEDRARTSGGDYLANARLITAKAQFWLLIAPTAWIYLPLPDKEQRIAEILAVCEALDAGGGMTADIRAHCDTLKLFPDEQPPLGPQDALDPALTGDPEEMARYQNFINEKFRGLYTPELLNHELYHISAKEAMDILQKGLPFAMKVELLAIIMILWPNEHLEPLTPALNIVRAAHQAELARDLSELADKTP